MTRVVVCSGEPSGDAMAQELVPALRARFGAGLRLAVLSSSPIDGLAEDEVLCQAPEPMLGLSIGAANRWRPVLARVSEALAAEPPDLFIAIAHHGFNLVLAAELKGVAGAKARALMVAPPEIWAWDVRGWLRPLGPVLRWVAPRRQSLPFVVAAMLDRGRNTLRLFDGIACLTEPNLDAYRRLDRKHDAGRKVIKVGHAFARYADPDVREQVAQAARDLRTTLVRSADSRLLGLFPGSRKAEVARLLPIMLDAVERVHARFGDRLEIVASASDERRTAQIRQMLDAPSRGRSLPPIPVVTAQAEALLGAADVGLICSGTVTLLAACLGLPSVVIYTPGWSLPLTLLAHLVVRRGRVSAERGAPPVGFALPSAIVGERVFAELALRQCKPRRVAAALEKLIDDERAEPRMRGHQERLLGVLGPSAPSAEQASAAHTPMERVAELALQLVRDPAARG